MFSSKRGSRQAAESAKKETIRTIDAPQANSQAGIGRSCRATSAWANGRPCSRVDAQLRDLFVALVQLDLEEPFDVGRERECRGTAGGDLFAMS